MLPLFLSLVVFLCAGTDLYAKPPGSQQPELVEIVVLDYRNNFQPPLDVYTVPVDKRLVITDVIRRCGVQGKYSIFRDGTIVSRVEEGVYQNSYVSGIEFQENQIVSIQSPPVSSGPGCDWELRGVLTDIN